MDSSGLTSTASAGETVVGRGADTLAAVGGDAPRVRDPVEFPDASGLAPDGPPEELPFGRRWSARTPDGRSIDVLVFARPLSAAGDRRRRSLLDVRHENLASVIDVGTTPTGPYVVSERADGESLDERVRRDGPTTQSAAIGLALQAAHGLREAAFRGAVHGDLSPLVVRIDDAGRLRVEGVGLGGLRSGERPVPAPAFASPERLRGSPPPDARSDVYSLGAVLHFLTTGRAPYDGDRDEVARRQRLRGRPDPREARPGLSSSTVALILSFTELDPDRRPATWEAAIDALERGLAAADADPRADEAPPPKRRPRRARGLRTFAVLAVLPVVVAGALVYFAADGRPPARGDFDAALRRADALASNGDVAGARIVLGRFATDADADVAREAAERLADLARR